LRRKRQTQFVQKHLLLGFGFGIAREDQGAAVGGWQMHIHHFDCTQAIECFARGEAGRVLTKFVSQGHLQAVAQEGDEDVCFDAVFELVMDRPQIQIALERFKSFFHVG